MSTEHNFAAEATPTATPTHDVTVWLAVWLFVVDTVVGLLLFGTIGAAAVPLSLAVALLKLNDVDSVVIFGLKVAEYGLLAVDVTLFFRFIYTAAARTWKALR